MTEDNINLLGLAPRHLQIVTRLLAEHVPDRQVWAFGSRAFGKSRRWSDLDLAIGGPAPLRMGVRMDLLDAFDASLLPIEVDVIDLNDIDPDFRSRIERDFVPLQTPEEVLA